MVYNSTEPESVNCSLSIFPNIASTTQYYTYLHVHLVLIICPLGLLTNLLTAITLNQPAMKSPTNLLLTFLAISDGLIMALYIVFDIKFLRSCSLQSSPLNWARYLLFSLVVQNIFHLFSSYLIVVLAVFRLIYIRFPHRAIVLCTMKRARYSICKIFFLSIVLSIPYMVAHKVTKIRPTGPTASNGSFYTVDYVSNKLGKLVQIWNSIFVKTLPIILMTALSLCLIYELKASEKRRQKLKSDHSNSLPDKALKPLNNKSRHVTETNNRTIKATRILLAIIFIFMVSYLPQATLLLLTGIFGECFSSNVYDKLGDIMDLLTLVNACIYFTLYCSMSKQFRETFIVLFISIPLSHLCYKRTVVMTEDESTQLYPAVETYKLEQNCKYKPYATKHFQEGGSC